MDDRRISGVFGGIVAFFLVVSPFSANADGLQSLKSDPVPGAVTRELSRSIVLEARQSFERGTAYLLSRQGEDGAWLKSSPVTALCCVALIGAAEPGERGESIRRALASGRGFLLANVRKDGSIADAGSPYVNYSTAICLAALAEMNHEADREIMRAARRFLIGSQLSEDNTEHPTSKENPFYGGIGYGSAGPDSPDLSNTQWALEALHLTEFLDAESGGGTDSDRKRSGLAWERARQFLRAVQNIPSDAGNTWVVDLGKDPKQDGGFIYKPGESKAPSDGGEGGLRSYGSMTYAGIKSMIYAKLAPEDSRVIAALEWAKRNYTVSENPGIGQEGFYYYLLVFAKAHGVFGEPVVVTPDGKTHDWRLDLIRQLLNTQRADGSWANANGRWMENMPELVTAYSLTAMRLALGRQFRDAVPALGAK